MVVLLGPRRRAADAAAEDRILGSITRARIIAETDALEEPARSTTCGTPRRRSSRPRSRAVQPIAAIDDLELPAAPGPVTLRAREAMEQAIERELGARV